MKKIAFLLFFASAQASMLGVPITCFCAPAGAQARQSSESLLPISAQELGDSSFFRNRWHSGDLVTYLEALDDNVVYQGTHTGDWQDGDQLIFSVAGNSFRWNRYYLDGFRIDNRFQVGSTSYVPNMEVTGLTIDNNNSRLLFSSLADGKDYVSLTGNIGGVGGISPGTAWVVHRFHGTGEEDRYSDDIYKRQHIRGSGRLDMMYSVFDKQGNRYRQHILASYGSRAITNRDENGIVGSNPYYTGNHYKIQGYGQFSIQPTRWFKSLNYLFNLSGTTAGGSEFYYNPSEVYKLNTFSASVYAKQRYLTTGLTWSLNRVKHRNLQYSRNVIDQDGESFYPWTPDGITHELSWSLTADKPLLPWLHLKADCYNSLIAYNPSQEHFSNEEYCRYMESDITTPLYRYEWTSKAFAAGLLENQVGLYYQTEGKGQKSKVDFSAHVDLTMDGMLMGNGKSKVTPYFEAGAKVDYQPWKWLNVALELEHSRVRYDLNTIQYMSDNYLSANVYYSSTNKLFTQTGGRYHHYASGLWQPAYVTLNIPIRLRFGRHEIALLQTFRKYYHTWNTTYTNGIDANGSWVSGCYMLNAGERDYTVGYLPGSWCGTGLIHGSPYYFSQLSRYTFYGRRFTASISWQSLQGSSPVAVENGPSMNNYNALSESTANPNTALVDENPGGKYPASGRVDQDKGFILRTYFAYDICRFLQVGLTAKWTDGQPFSWYRTSILTADDGTSQFAVKRSSSRGTNPTDGDFGCRESAIFNFDLHVKAQWQAWKRPMSLYVQCYNVWDFGNVLNEYCFTDGTTREGSRGWNMMLTLPRGFIATLKIEL